MTAPQQAAAGQRPGPGRGRGRAAHRGADGEVTEAQLRIYEPPRFFEAFLRGREYTEVTDITSGSAASARSPTRPAPGRRSRTRAASSLGPQIDALRRLLYCGEWISSHALHIYLLHAPDFLGYPDAVALARDHRAAVERGWG